MPQPCCGCFTSLLQGIQKHSGLRSRPHRRARYHEGEYSIEFENLIEESDFYTPAQHAVSDTERQLLSNGKYHELVDHDKRLKALSVEEQQRQEEKLRLEDEAYYQAKREAAHVARQSSRKPKDSSKNGQATRAFGSVEFSKWLAQESIDVNSPELDADDFDTFLKKVKAKSLASSAWQGSSDGDEAWEQTISEGWEATKIAGAALSALQPVDLHAVSPALPSVRSSALSSVTTRALVTATHAQIHPPAVEPKASLNTPAVLVSPMASPPVHSADASPTIEDVVSSGRPSGTSSARVLKATARVLLLDDSQPAVSLVDSLRQEPVLPVIPSAKDSLAMPTDLQLLESQSSENGDGKLSAAHGVDVNVEKLATSFKMVPPEKLRDPVINLSEESSDDELLASPPYGNSAVAAFEDQTPAVTFAEFRDQQPAVSDVVDTRASNLDDYFEDDFVGVGNASGFEDILR